MAADYAVCVLIVCSTACYVPDPDGSSYFLQSPHKIGTALIGVLLMKMSGLTMVHTRSWSQSRLITGGIKL